MVGWRGSFGLGKMGLSLICVKEACVTCGIWDVGWFYVRDEQCGIGWKILGLEGKMFVVTCHVDGCLVVSVGHPTVEDNWWGEFLKHGKMRNFGGTHV